MKKADQIILKDLRLKLKDQQEFRIKNLGFVMLMFALHYAVTHNDWFTGLFYAVGGVFIMYLANK